MVKPSILDLFGQRRTAETDPNNKYATPAAPTPTGAQTNQPTANNNNVNVPLAAAVASTDRNDNPQASKRATTENNVAATTTTTNNASATTNNTNQNRRVVYNPYAKNNNNNSSSSANKQSTAASRANQNSTQSNSNQPSTTAGNTYAIAAANANRRRNNNNPNVPNNSNATNNQTSNSNGGDNSENTATDNSTASDDERWPPHHMEFFKDVKSEVDSCVNFFYTRTQKGRFKGKYPSKYDNTVSPSDNPLRYFGFTPLPTMEQFCYPDMHVFYPEAQYPWLYPDARPKCKWHDTTECVERAGWMRAPRHAYSSKRHIALLGRYYKCTARENAVPKIHPFYFRGIDKDVIAKADDYVQIQWEKNGFDISHRAAISMSELEHLRSDLNQGLGINPFRRSMLEAHKLHHMRLSRQWVSYVRMLDRMVGSGCDQPPDPFPDFDSDLYHQSLPSNAYLISRVVKLMESDMEYKTRRMQMLDGKHLSGDHSFKLAKCVISNGSKVFAAMYCVMNEFGQVLAWWFTTGTGMAELEESFVKLKQRYVLLGYDHPESVTTDRCCQERKYWKRVLDFVEDQLGSELLDEEDIETIQVADMPCVVRDVAYTLEVTELYLGEISEYLSKQPRELQVIIVDGEWRVPSTKADVLIVDLLNDEAPFIFSISSICKRGAQFPRGLKHLLEDSTVMKVGNRICNDESKFRGWGVEMSPTQDLGHLAFDRCITPTRHPSIQTIIGTLYPGVIVDGKDELEGGARISDWSGVLTPDQVGYASNDGYTHRIAYQRMHQIMDARAQAKLKVGDIVEGLAITLYSDSVSQRSIRVAEGTACRRAPGRYPQVVVEIDLRDDSTIFAPGTLAEVFDEEADEPNEKETLASLCEEGPSTVRIIWPLTLCRRTVNFSGLEDAVTINTKEKQVLLDCEDEYDADNEGDILEDTNQDNDDDDSTNSDNTENSTNLPQPNSSGSQRRRRYRLRRERVKNDIAHLFFRFERVLGKEHGAYNEFRIALRDALYVLNQDDLDQCVRSLREDHNLSDEQIEEKMRTNFRWFKRRVRRHVPAPRELSRRYLAVYNRFKDIVDAKTGKKLFGKKKAKNAHKSCLKHIQRNCISDIPLVSYYTPAGTDKNGLVLYKCLRGTDALEGLHQKLRQLVRGFSNSPRLMLALISDFFLRWNQNIDIKIRGLPEIYDGLYAGEMIEDEIEKMSLWPNLEHPPHPDWASTRSVQNTGEVFGLTDSMATMRMNAEDGDSESDQDLNECADEAAEQLNEEEIGSPDDEDELMMDHLTASEQWLAALCGRKRANGRVKAKEEWRYFNENVTKYQNIGGISDEADNYSSISFSAFARDWNNWVRCLGRAHPDVTYKTASQLQDAFKVARKYANKRATLRPHREQLDNLQEQHRDKDQSRAFAAEFAGPNAASRVMPLRPATQAIHTQTEETCLGEPDNPAAAAAAMPASLQVVQLVNATPAEVARATGSGPNKSRRASARCRKCGLVIKDYHDKHEAPPSDINDAQRPQSRALKRYSQEYCSVADDPLLKHLIEPPFPVAPGKRIPPPPKKRKSDNIED